MANPKGIRQTPATSGKTSRKSSRNAVPQGGKRFLVMAPCCVHDAMHCSENNITLIIIIMPASSSACSAPLRSTSVTSQRSLPLHATTQYCASERRRKKEMQKPSVQRLLQYFKLLSMVAGAIGLRDIELGIYIYIYTYVKDIRRSTSPIAILIQAANWAPRGRRGSTLQGSQGLGMHSMQDSGHGD